MLSRALSWIYNHLTRQDIALEQGGIWPGWRWESSASR